MRTCRARRRRRILTEALVRVASFAADGQGKDGAALMWATSVGHTCKLLEWRQSARERAHLGLFAKMVGALERSAGWLRVDGPDADAPWADCQNGNAFVKADDNGHEALLQLLQSSIRSMGDEPLSSGGRKVTGENGREASWLNFVQGQGRNKNEIKRRKSGLEEAGCWLSSGTLEGPAAAESEPGSQRV